jgi:hypothetical protein
MIQRFYNNIFAAAYRSYDRYDTNSTPRFRAGSFLFMFIFGTFSLFVLLIRNITGLNLSAPDIKPICIASIVLFWILSFVLVRKYYTIKRVEDILEEFNNKSRAERRLWGFLSVILFIVKWVAFIYFL